MNKEQVKPKEIGKLSLFKKMKSYNVDISQFIRDAIAEKIKKEYANLIPKPKKIKCPF